MPWKITPFGSRYVTCVLSHKTPQPIRRLKNYELYVLLATRSQRQTKEGNQRRGRINIQSRTLRLMSVLDSASSLYLRDAWFRILYVHSKCVFLIDDVAHLRSAKDMKILLIPFHIMHFRNEHISVFRKNTVKNLAFFNPHTLPSRSQRTWNLENKQTLLITGRLDYA